ncbi:MAG TPA: twitching motility protein [Verrucomicrobia bacterium]|nr:MAG: twitching motility protein [Lentisphaerae bacterium GWF2_57_35]HBA82911.1 twitching motility protein [Verrucomicrobiota bacterium]
MPLLRELLAKAVALGASDIHLKSNKPPIFRIHAELIDGDPQVLEVEDVRLMVESILPPYLRARFDEEHQADFSLAEKDIGRFRVNAFMSSGMCTVVFRHVKSKIPNFQDLHLPAILEKLALSPRGIMLAAGTTGSGKSTSLAAVINHINHNERRRIISIEDPVEYVFEDIQSVISQREVGLDTLSFHASLKSVLRQDPDVIMIGEMRDAESFMAALSAAETGHLVLSTLHTGTAAQAIPRILDFFPASERDQLRMALADNMRAVFCQRLIPAVKGGVRPAVEIMINTPTVRKLIEKNLLEKLPAGIETGGEDGMQTFNQAIFKLIKAGEITEENGMRYAGNAEALRMNLKGIFLDEANRIIST